MSASDLPTPAALGVGWGRWVDPGSPEDGNVGNGAWVRARPGAEVVAGLLPLGCAGPLTLPRLPVPEHALEATYRGPPAAPAVPLVLSFSSSASASALVAGLTAVGRVCVAPATVVRHSAPLVAVVSEQRSSPGTVVHRRRELGAGADSWIRSETVVGRGRGSACMRWTPGRATPHRPWAGC